MYTYEFKIIYPKKDIPSYVTIEVNEMADQLAYCNEGKRAGWIKSFNYTIVKEEW